MLYYTGYRDISIDNLGNLPLKLAWNTGGVKNPAKKTVRSAPIG